MCLCGSSCQQHQKKNQIKVGEGEEEKEEKEEEGGDDDGNGDDKDEDDEEREQEQQDSRRGRRISPCLIIIQIHCFRKSEMERALGVFVHPTCIAICISNGFF